MKWKLAIGGATVTIALLAILFLQRSPISCGNLVDRRLSYGAFQNTTLYQLQQWIEENYVLSNWFREEDRQDDVAIISWPTLNNRYFSFEHNGTVSVRQIWRLKKVTVKDILRCMGPPEQYAWTAQFPADAFRSHFALWYTSKGYIFATGGFYSATNPVIDLNTNLGVLIVVEPNTVETMARAAYPPSVFGSDLYVDSLATIRKWPDNFENIMLDRTDVRSD